VAPYLTVKNAAAALDFYKKVFNAEETLRHASPDGQIMHAQIRIGKSTIMVGESRKKDVDSPASVTMENHPCVTVHVYIENVDEVFARALANGAVKLRDVEDQFYGDRSGGVVDPFGPVVWWISTHKKDVSEEEMTALMKAEKEKADKKQKT